MKIKEELSLNKNSKEEQNWNNKHNYRLRWRKKNVNKSTQKNLKILEINNYNNNSKNNSGFKKLKT